MERAVRTVSRITLERCLLQCLDAGGFPPELRDAPVPPQLLQPQELTMMQTIICNLEVQLPAAMFGAMLPQREKIRLQCTSREV